MNYLTKNLIYKSQPELKTQEYTTFILFLSYAIYKIVQSNWTVIVGFFHVRLVFKMYMELHNYVSVLSFSNDSNYM